MSIEKDDESFRGDDDRDDSRDDPLGASQLLGRGERSAEVVANGESLDPDTVNNEDLIREAAEAGALCSECGGLHVAASIESAIRVLAETEDHENAAPWCQCRDCPYCGDLVRAVHAMQDAERELPLVINSSDNEPESLEELEEQD